MSNFYIEYETTAGTQYQEFVTGELLRQFILDNKTTFINHCKVVAKLPEITDCSSLFQNCTATSIDLSSFDTSNVTTMASMFWGSQATDLDLSSFDTSKVTNMVAMFFNCSATSLDLSNFDNSKVTNMSNMFRYSQATTGYARTQADADKLNSSSNKPVGLTFMVKPNFHIEYETSSGQQTQSFTTGALLRTFIMDNKATFINHCKVVAKLPEITSCAHLFQNCTATSLDLSSFDTSNVTDMSWMFSSSQATSIDLSNFDTSNVTDMHGMFYSSQTTTLDLSNFDTSNVTNMYGMFNSSQATTLDLSNFDTSNVTNMYGMFNYNQATTLDLSSFDTSNVTNMSQMFGYSSATTLDLSGFDTSKVTNMANMFFNCLATTGYARTIADADRFNSSLGKPVGLVFVVKPDFYIEYETTFGTQYQEFTTGALLRQFIMDNKTTFINHCKVVAKLPEITDCYDLFYSCSADSIDLSEFDTSNVTSMFRMFYQSQATTLDLSSFDTSNVTNMTNMFNASPATTLDLSNFDTSKVTSMSSMFRQSQATSLDVSSFDTSNVTDMSSMFRQSQVTTLDLSSFDTSNVTNMSYMFRDCSATTGYARTQADADRVNSSSNKPAGLIFIVKPKPIQIDKVLFNNVEYTKVVYENKVLWSKDVPAPTYPERVLVSTGTQYINTGLKGKSSLKVETKINGTVAWQQFALFGSRQIGSNNAFVVWILDTNFRFDYASETNKQFYGSFVRPQPYVIKKDGRFNYIDDVLVQTNTDATFENTIDFTLFNINSGGTMDYRPAKMKMYWFKMWDNDELVRDFIPVGTGDVVDGLTAPSNCLYCKVTKQFYTNQGTGTFDIEDV